MPTGLNYVIANRNDLQSVADAIKAKAELEEGTTLSFPTDFVNVIDNIELGYVSGDIGSPEERIDVTGTVYGDMYGQKVHNEEFDEYFPAACGNIYGYSDDVTSYQVAVCGSIYGNIYGVYSDVYGSEVAVNGTIVGDLIGIDEGSGNTSICGVIHGNVCGVYHDPYTIAVDGDVYGNINYVYGDINTVEGYVSEIYDVGHANGAGSIGDSGLYGSCSDPSGVDCGNYSIWGPVMYGVRGDITGNEYYNGDGGYNEYLPAVCGNIYGVSRYDETLGYEYYTPAICGSIYGDIYGSYNSDLNIDIAVCGAIYGNIIPSTSGDYTAIYGTVGGNICGVPDEWGNSIAVCGSIYGSVDFIYGQVMHTDYVTETYGAGAVGGSIDSSMTDPTGNGISGSYSVWGDILYGVYGSIYGNSVWDDSVGAEVIQPAICGGVNGYSPDGMSYEIAICGSVYGDINEVYFGAVYYIYDGRVDNFVINGDTYQLMNTTCGKLIVPQSFTVDGTTDNYIIYKLSQI